MEVDENEIQTPVRKYQRADSDTSSNPNKIAIHKGNSDVQNQINHRFLDDGGGGVGRILGWPSSRIVRVSRVSGGKDRHSKVLTSKGLRDRRVRLSVNTAIQFYDLQDRLGYDQPSKAVEWLIKAAASSISELPSLDPLFSGTVEGHNYHQKQLSDDKKSTGNDNEFEDPNCQNNHNNNNNNNVSLSKSSACSSTSETSKGSGLSLSRSENRIRETASKNKKEKESDSVRVSDVNQVNGISQNSSFTDLLTGGISSATVSLNNSNPAVTPESRIHWTTPMEYFLNRQPQSSPQIIGQIPQFNITAEVNHNHNQQQHHFSFLQENFSPVVTSGGAGGSGGGGESYNLNFSMAPSSSGGVVAPGFNRGTLQSNLLSTLPHNYHLQRFPSSMADGNASSNFPFFFPPSVGAGAPDQFPSAGYDFQRLQLYGGGDGGERHSEHHKEKPKN